MDIPQFCNKCGCFLLTQTSLELFVIVIMSRQLVKGQRRWWACGGEVGRGGGKKEGVRVGVD